MKKKILFLIESFAGGGVEKVFIDLINNKMCIRDRY